MTSEAKKEIAVKIKKLVDLLNQEIRRANLTPELDIKIIQTQPMGVRSSEVTVEITETICY